jgi:hypothetical protein
MCLLAVNVKLASAKGKSHKNFKVLAIPIPGIIAGLPPAGFIDSAYRLK